ncbi:MAG: prephenate dehydratase [Deltaproteobacteria bacterium]|nr:prephenate dehydratase [Deltaproteobacteria bacterium]
MSDPSPNEKALAALRDAIDAIDSRILALLNDRARLNSEVGRLKSAGGTTPFVPARELEIFERLERSNPGPFPTAAIRKVFREIISASIALQRGVTVAYLGPPATYTHQAAIQQFGRMADLRPAPTTDAIFAMVESGQAEFGVVPIENSNEGVVSHTLDLFVESPLTIAAEIHVPIHHDLLSKQGELRAIRAVYSHPQALAQCRAWLDLNLPDVPQQGTHSTAQAAELAARSDEIGAIASPVAAELYGLRVVSVGIEDHADNTTRFLVISKTAPTRSSRDITSILFSIKRDVVGALYKALEPFYQSGVNLTRIESRPTRGRAWEYVFFCDFEGHVEDPKVASAIAALRPRCDFVKVLGSYPQAEATS